MSKTNALKGTTLALALSGILSIGSTPTYAILGDQTLKNGIDHQDVQVLQEELKNFGLFSGDTTTYFGAITEKSVIAFQESQGLDNNGIFDITTFQALLALKEKSPTTDQVTEVVELEPEVTTTGKGALIYNRALKTEDTGDDVILLQEALKGLGFLVIDNTTNYFGTQTEEALKAFQTSQELLPDGVAGLRTIEAINKTLTGRGISVSVVSRGSDLGSRVSNIIETGKKYLGVPYVFGGTSSKGFDCSGFTQFVYKQNGITVPRATTGQATAGTKLSKADLQAGDLIIFSNTYKAGPSHAGIYIGNGQFIHASSVGSGGVIISDLNSNYYSSHFSYGRRVF